MKQNWRIYFREGALTSVLFVFRSCLLFVAENSLRHGERRATSLEREANNPSDLAAARPPPITQGRLLLYPTLSWFFTSSDVCKEKFAILNNFLSFFRQNYEQIENYATKSCKKCILLLIFAHNGCMMYGTANAVIYYCL